MAEGGRFPRDTWKPPRLAAKAGRDREGSAKPEHPVDHSEFLEPFQRARSLAAKSARIALMAQCQVSAQRSTPPRSVGSTWCGISFFTSELHCHSGIDASPRSGHWQN